MSNNYNEELKKVILLSESEAIRLGNNAISPDHFMLGILRSGTSHIRRELAALELDVDEFKFRLDQVLIGKEDAEVKQSNDDGLPCSAAARRVLYDAYQEAKSMGSDFMCEWHILLALLMKPDNATFSILMANGIDFERIKSVSEEFLIVKDTDEDEDDDREDEDDTDSKGGRRRMRTFDDEQSTLDIEDFMVNLTDKAKAMELDPVVGRDVEIERLVQILCRRKKNNPVLIGEPGVGKTAIVEGLAMRIAAGHIPHQLRDKELFALDLTSVVAGTKFRGEFEERMKMIMDEVRSKKNYILFIDEMHTMVGAGSASGTMDAANILKPALSRGEFQCIGTTTINEYRKHIETDGALDRRFQKVMVESPTSSETLAILQKLRTTYENFHNVEYTEEALEACVHLTDRYVSDRQQPDKAIDIMDEVGARLATSQPESKRAVWLSQQMAELRKQIEQAELEEDMDEFNTLKERQTLISTLIANEIKEMRENSQLVVNPDMVADVVSMSTRIPVQRVQESESARLLNLEGELKARVIGQNDAIEAIARSIRRNRAGLRNPNRPIGAFLFLGPTGVGKTYLAKQLAKQLFESEKNFIRVDMSEFQEGFSTSRLIGAPPGYVGFEEGGELTEKVRRNPYSVVLLDEIEKASPDVYNLLLQVLDEGHLTEGNGRTVDFRNTLIIMTSNVGSRELREFGDGIGFAPAHRLANMDEHQRGFLTKAINRRFPPEFINRVDELVFFSSLNHEHIESILEVELRDFDARILDMGYELTISKSLREHLAAEGYDPHYGARPLRRALQRYVEDPLADFLLANEGKAIRRVEIDYDPKEGVKLSVSKETRQIETRTPSEQTA